MKTKKDEGYGMSLQKQSCDMTNEMKDSGTYSISEVAKLMDMTLKVVRRYVASGELRTTKVNNTYSISKEDLDGFMKYIEEGEDEKRAQKVAKIFWGRDSRKCET